MNFERKKQITFVLTEYLFQKKNEMENWREFNHDLSKKGDTHWERGIKDEENPKREIINHMVD